ncbi:hypothetical protein AKJ09_09059 [Labilithrix luteola]|uniref:Uncharacterized protein n=1 Tax=Labilithrix luteola TaxID=1391654 RepID=A0A0K1Q9C6_9BACT|nr:hypothetical protein [Labilithrix luteola]AKV02396.1 hypothetical protein AKJ09_09059 [Labilithrix luteola]
MLSRFRHVLGAVSVLLIASCSGGGCSSGCSSCGGSTPLPGGFPKDKAITNAASVRLSRPGLDFIEQNLGGVAASLVNGGGGTFSVDIPNIDPPKTSIGLGTSIDPNICPDGPKPTATPPQCHAEVGLANATFKIDAVKPNTVSVHAVVPLKVDDTPVVATVEPPVGSFDITLHIGYGDGDCVDGAPQVKPHALPLAITLPLIAETSSPRDGYTKVDVDNAVINLDGLTSDDVKVCAKCSFATSVCDAVLNSSFVKGLIVDPLKNSLEGQVRSLLSEQLCTAPNPTLNPPCPSKTAPDSTGKKCVFDDDKTKCVATLLGTDAHVDLGGLLASFSPGTAGGLDFGLAAAGDMQPLPGLGADGTGHTKNGITLGMIGGVLPQPPSKCVPQANVTVPTNIPIPDELAPTQADPADASHLGIALAGRFLDYSLTSVYNSGLLCLGVSTEQVDMLKAGLLSIIIPSIKNLTFERGDAAAAIATRPQAPPSLKLGAGTQADPLLTVSLPKFAVDFYIWHLDRFVRAFTFQADLTVPVNLETAKDPVKNPNGGLVPTIGDIGVANGAVTNNDLLLDDPKLVASALSGLLGGLGKQLVGGGISPIDLSSALSSFGLGLQIDGIKKLTKGNDDFLGLFAKLSKTAGTATVEADTFARLVSKTVHPESMQLTTYSRDALPELVVEASSPLENDGTHAVEYSWAIDRGTRSPWSRDKHIVIKDDQLFLQGKHVLKVSARVADEPLTEDATPAEIPFVIDALAPFVAIEKVDRSAKIDAWDLVSEVGSLVGRYRLDGQPFGEFRPIAEMAQIDVGGAAEIDVEVKDEEGNVRSVKQALVRGRGDSSLGSASSCGCSTPGRTSTDGNTLALALGIGGLALVGLRRWSRRSQRASDAVRTFGASSRTAALALGTVGVVAATSQGCSCGSEEKSATGCGADCNQACLDGFSQGMPGAYTSVAKAADGSIWVAGYNDALLDQGDSELWGDLVVGKFDAGKQRVEWLTVDGLPKRTEGCPDRSPASWRRGESDSGDDVGLWTSIQTTGDGHPMVSYYDATNHRLKFATEDANGWKASVLKEVNAGDVGRYSKMILVDGKPVIAFLQIEQGTAGHTRSKVVLATAKSGNPKEASDFTFTDVAVEEENPCLGSVGCAGSQVCIKSTGLCSDKVSGCTPEKCASGKECVTVDGKASCEAVQGTIETYPNVFGGYISIAKGPSGLGITTYDRAHGNLVALVQKGSAWDRVIVDGETGSRADKTAIDTGDVGIASSLAIDSAGTWHISYVSGLDESVRYVTLTDSKPNRPEIIDDGSAVGGATFPDGKHVVGDDSVIRVEGDVVTIYYQDASVGTLRRAVGTLNGATHKWDLRALPQPDKFAGFFPQFIPGEDKVANFWRQTDHVQGSVTGDVSILAP